MTDTDKHALAAVPEARADKTPNRQPLDDGGWFDLDTAQSWDETTTYNGNNHVSDATGSQWEHETLYRSDKGAWILEHTSQWQGRLPTWRRVDPAEAAEWLIRCGHDVPEELADAAAELEV